MSEHEPSVYCAEFRAALQATGKHAATIGGLAANRYRLEERYTKDADVLVDSLDGVAEMLEARGLRTRIMSEQGEPYAIFGIAADWRIDVMLAETDFQKSALERETAGFITVEDLIVFKLLAWRPRDINDIEEILKRGLPLDHAYIERWSSEWDILDRWTQIRDGST